nr:MAG TPA: hypothetical protein [Bacteriophage sp.]
MVDFLLLLVKIVLQVVTALMQVEVLHRLISMPMPKMVQLLKVIMRMLREYLLLMEI